MKAGPTLDENSKHSNINKSHSSSNTDSSIYKSDKYRHALQPYGNFSNGGNYKGHKKKIPQSNEFKPSMHSDKAGLLMIPKAEIESAEARQNFHNTEGNSDITKYNQINQFLKVTCSNLREKAKGLLENSRHFRQNFTEIINRYKKIYERQFYGLFKTEQTQKILKGITAEYNKLVATYNQNMAQLKFFRDIFIDFKSLQEEKLVFYENFLENGLENIRNEMMNRKGRYLQNVKKVNKIIEDDDEFFRFEPSNVEPKTLEQFITYLTDLNDRKREADLDELLRKKICQEEYELNVIFFKNIKTEQVNTDSFSNLLEPNESGSEARDSSQNFFMKSSNVDRTNVSDRSLEAQLSSVKKPKNNSSSNKLQRIIEMNDDSSKSIYELLLREKNGTVPPLPQRTKEISQNPSDKQKAESVRDSKHAKSESMNMNSEIISLQPEKSMLGGLSETIDRFYNKSSYSEVSIQKKSHSATNFFNINEKKRKEDKNKFFKEKSIREKRQISEQILKLTGNKDKSNSMITYSEFSEINQDDPSSISKIEREIEEIKMINGGGRHPSKGSPLKKSQIYNDMTKKHDRAADTLKKYTSGIIKREHAEARNDRSSDNIIRTSKNEKLSTYLDKIIRSSAERKNRLNNSMTVRDPITHPDSNNLKKTARSTGNRSASSEGKIKGKDQVEGNPRNTDFQYDAIRTERNNKEDTNILSKISTWKRAALENFIRSEVLNNEEFRKPKISAGEMRVFAANGIAAAENINGAKLESQRINEFSTKKISNFLPIENKVITPSWNVNMTSNTNTSVEALNSSDQSKRRSREERLKKKLEST